MPVTDESNGEELPRFETGAYILRNLIRDVALNAGDESNNVQITCVEFWQENLYIGTSVGEILHHVQIPPDPNDPKSSAAFILASRLQPPVNNQVGAGIQQILLLPAVSKACILSNNTLNFYTLPELSPAFPQLKPLTCGWVGGVDLSDDEDQDEQREFVPIMMCLRNKIRIVKIGQQAQKERDIDFGGCLATVRRGNVACVADARSYALLDVIAQQKIPLLSISSLDEQSPEQAGTGTLQDEMWPGTGVSRSSSAAGSRTQRLAVPEKGHSRSTSLGVFRTESPLGDSSRGGPSLRHGFDVPSMLRQSSPQPTISPERRGSVGTHMVPNASKALPTLPQEPTSTEAARQASPTKKFVPLRPIIASPTESEFLVVTGTSPSEPGVGMFVNLDGEVTRGSLDFESFPTALVVDGKGVDMSVSMSQVDAEAQHEGYALAVMRREVNGNESRDVEIQRWDADSGGSAPNKEWLGVASRKHGLSPDTVDNLHTLGIRKTTEEVNFDLPEIVEKLASQVIRLSANKDEPDLTKISQREKEERTFYGDMATARTRIALWAGKEVFWMIRNPSVLQLDARLRLAQCTSVERNAPLAPQRQTIESLLNDLRGQKSEDLLEIYTLAYIRQKAAMLLFFDLVLQTVANKIASTQALRSVEDALLESDIDPRFVLHFLPSIASEVLQAPEGIWIQGGIKEIIDRFVDQHDSSTISTDRNSAYTRNLLQLARRYLLTWREKRGNPSVSDGDYVFPSVDAALLSILLTLDRDSPKGHATLGSVRAELNSMVDGGVECFDRAVELLEQNNRLYTLSRLYQSKKQSENVLATWKRIIAGEEDAGGEFPSGEQELKTYLTKLRNRQLVEEYGTWLANRNPKLGVQVFADDSSRTTWSPAEALALLREHAPAAVKEYLEYLVFAKKQAQHINELIAYFLDIVISELASSNSSREILENTYETYRALRPPKPTYRQFIADNAINAEWWHSRLRLLQLLGGTQGPAGSYDVEIVLQRLAPYSESLVPEMIILNGRQGHHKEAIRLLTHGLGDFDMAITYCLRGGGNIYSTLAPTSDITREHQSSLFRILLAAFLDIQDPDDRIERTGELLERFGGWFEVEYVLSVLPEQWSVEIFAPFLVSALRRIVREKNETRVTRALRGAENLARTVEKIERVEEVGAVVQT